MANELADITSNFDNVDFYFKASYDKANRSSGDSPRGVGIHNGANILSEIRDIGGIKTLTDIHNPGDVWIIRHAVDVLQIPAFLSRQTDLLVEAGKAGNIVNIKKGQWMSPWDIDLAVDKVKDSSIHGVPSEVWVTERGTSFGYNNLVNDFKGIVHMKQSGHNVIFDATHSAQTPGSLGGSSGGDRTLAPYLAYAATATGCIDGVFMEVHDDPDNAPSDGPNMIKLSDFGDILNRILDFNSVSDMHSVGAFFQ